MTFSYLDVQKSVMISSPAGSGKTEKLARRYIALLRSGVEVERILAITFTDKAAAEMKRRILRILREEDKELFSELLQKMPLMRVSTIHSFCGTLLRRFSFEASLDPNYSIEDTIDARIAWDRILYEILLEAGTGKTGNALLLESLSEKGFRGLNYLKTMIDYLFEKIPFSLEAEIPELSRSSEALAEELRDWPGAEAAVVHYGSLFRDDGISKLVNAEKYFLTKSNTPRKRTPAPVKGIQDYQCWALKMFQFWSEKGKEEFRLRAERLKSIFIQCFKKYGGKKASKGILDFSDLEYITFKLLTEEPEWSNILYAFDEKTDHILVDEFQDTNDFQWAIIDKLTEEWRSGLGAKREEGTVPTLFLVGDEKQSIYYFRGANVEIFNRAKKKLGEWLNREFYYEEVKENFRSLPAITDFTNVLFSTIMSTADFCESDEGCIPPWMTKYREFKACRNDTKDVGKVEIILLDDDGSATSEIRQKEANVIAKRIQGLIDDYRITEKTGKPDTGSRPCRYMDIAILIRKRTHLKKYEEAFRRLGIPFVALKGIGFYQEPEIATLRAFVYFLSNPYDDSSLYILLKSPFFLIDEGSVIQAVNSKGDCLFSKWKNIHASSTRLLDQWLQKIQQVPLSELIEEALSQTKAWEFFHEAQKRANVKKFIKLVEDLEADGKSLPKIRDFLERTEERAEEPKANVNTEGMDAVRIMTIHGAKGLEFPVVFVPGVDEGFITKTGDCLIYDSAGKLFFKYIPQAAVRQMDEDFIVHSEKEYEEQKRLFYVAVTRAEQALFLTGQWNENNKGFLGFLQEGLGLYRASNRQGLKGESRWNVTVKLDGLSVVSDHALEALYERKSKPVTTKKGPALAEFVPVRVETVPVWKGVTEVVDIQRQHGKDWLHLGDIIHRLLEDVSKAFIEDHAVYTRARKLMISKGVAEDQQKRFMSIIKHDIMLLREKGLWDEVVLPRKEAYAELPFVLDEGDVIYSGRIDRVICRNGRYTVYDYKTFPVKGDETDYLLKSYSSQLRIYRKAVSELFPAVEVRSFVLFTHIGEMMEVF